MMSRVYGRNKELLGEEAKDLTHFFYYLQLTSKEIHLHSKHIRWACTD